MILVVMQDWMGASTHKIGQTQKHEHAHKHTRTQTHTNTHTHTNARARAHLIEEQMIISMQLRIHTNTPLVRRKPTNEYIR